MGGISGRNAHGLVVQAHGTLSNALDK